MNKLPAKSPTHRGFTSKALMKAIFEAEHPEQFVRAIPSQSFYVLIKQLGLASATDLIDMAPIEHIRTSLDFDLWEKDNFNEENFWEWLSLSDDSDPLRFQQKLLKCIDLKLVALLIGRYVEVQFYDEPADIPPGDRYYTPDKGYTWVYVNLEDAARHFLFTRFLALIFETNTELFYQLISIPSVSTLTNLEEESYQEKIKRLAAEGVPEPEHAASIHIPLSPESVAKDINAGLRHPVVGDVQPVEPMLYDKVQSLQPFAQVLNNLGAREEAESELTLIVNASIAFFGIPFYEYEAVISHVEKVKGVINIGLEAVQRTHTIDPLKAYEILGFQTLYRIGWFELRKLKRAAEKISLDEVKALAEDPVHFSLIAHLKLPFPELPAFLKEDGSLATEGEQLITGSRSVSHIDEVSMVLKKLEETSLA